MSEVSPHNESVGEAVGSDRPTGVRIPTVQMPSASRMQSNWKSIAVFIDDTPQGEKLGDHAADLAQRCGAHLIGIHAISGHPGETAASSFARGKLAIDAVIHDQRVAEEQTAFAVARRFAAVTRGRDISTEFRVIWSGHTDDAVPNALHSDLVVLGHPNPPGLSGNWSAERLLIATGVPVLIIPDGWSGTTIGTKALVAWNGSREARRAIFDGMPLLSQAKSVVVLVVDAANTPDKYGENPGADISLVLSRHDVRVELQQATSDGLSVAECILSRAVEQGVDLILIGAYSHVRAAELVVGGVTRAILANAPVPLLLSR